MFAFYLTIFRGYIGCSIGCVQCKLNAFLTELSSPASEFLWFFALQSAFALWRSSRYAHCTVDSTPPAGGLLVLNPNRAQPRAVTIVCHEIMQASMTSNGIFLIFHHQLFAAFQRNWQLQILNRQAHNTLMPTARIPTQGFELQQVEAINKQIEDTPTKQHVLIISPTD